MLYQWQRLELAEGYAERCVVASRDSSRHFMFDRRAVLTACGVPAIDAPHTVRPNDVTCPGCLHVLEQHTGGHLQPPGRARIAGKLKPLDR